MEDKSDEIDLIELFDTLFRYKKFIFMFTLVVTLSSVIYVNFMARSIYSANATLEIGQVINKDITTGIVQVIMLEKTPVIKSLVELKFGVSVSSINKSTLLKYSIEGVDKKSIENKLNKAVQYTLERDKKRAKLYSNNSANFIKTSIISMTSVSDKPIRPKKKLVVIVSFITSLILAIFLVFFIEFFNEIRKRREYESK